MKEYIMVVILCYVVWDDFIWESALNNMSGLEMSWWKLLFVLCGHCLSLSSKKRLLFIGTVLILKTKNHKQIIFPSSISFYLQPVHIKKKFLYMYNVAFIQPKS